MHSLKYIGQNDLEVIINSPDKVSLAERRILQKELEEIMKPSAVSTARARGTFPISIHWVSASR